MLAPIRTLVGLRRGTTAALISGAVGVSALFAATPFLIPLIADRYGIAVGTAGLISSVQVAGFAATTFVAGRWWVPSRGKLVGAAAVGLVFDAASAVAGSFVMLLGLRLVAGAAAGVFTWLAWADAMRDPASMRRVSAVGPVTTLVGAPVLAWIGSRWGAEGLYWALAVSCVPVAAMIPTFEPVGKPGRRRMSPSRSNVVLLVALGVLTLAGSSLFVFVGAFGTSQVGLGAVAVAVGFSVNAGSGLMGARWRRRPRWSGPWLAGAALSASVLVAVPHPVAFFLGMFGWGFAFWMAVPGVLGSIADWSFVPDERVGDAQSIMAVGRALGPLVGSVLLGAGTSYGRLGLLAGGGLLLAAVLTAGVEVHRHGAEPPTG